MEIHHCENPVCRFVTRHAVPDICPLCGGALSAKKSKRGRKFFGCDNYPKCKFATWNEPTAQVCPKCGKTLFKKKGKAPKLYCLTEGCGFEKAAPRKSRKSSAENGTPTEETP